MKLTLPESITLYFEAENRHAPALVPLCFVADARVSDENTLRQGIGEIQAWMLETGKKFQHSIEPISSSADGAAIIIRSRLTGSFPGSPVEVDFRFVLRNGKISQLDIQ